MNSLHYGQITKGVRSIVPAVLMVFGCIQCADVAAGSDVVTGAFFTGQYRNLFVEAGHSLEEVTNKINAAFKQLFHGEPQSESVYFLDGTNAYGPLAFICDINSRDVRSEGMSYGMMIAVQLDRKAEFDALWNWAMTHMYQASTNHPAYGYFAWSLGTNGVANDEMPAPDGEEYFAMSLYFAAHRLQAFFETQGVSSFGDRFSLDGQPRSTTHSAGLVAMNAVASLSATQPAARKFVDELWRTPVPTGQYRYYDGMLYLLGLLHCSGQFRIWLPR